MDPHSISVSADGATVAYSKFTSRQNIWQIAIPDTGTVSISEATPVTVGNQIVEMHGLSRDGYWLAYDSNLEGNQDIYLRPLAGGDPMRVTRDRGDDWGPDFSPDGSEIVFYSARHGTRDVFLISTDGTDEVRLTDGPGEDYHPSFSPDGLRIAFTRGRGLYLMSRDSLGGEWSVPELFTPDGRYARWSPDGSHIVTYARNQIWILPLHGKGRLLVDGAAVGFQWSGVPDWSPDGRFVYFTASDSTDTWELYAIPVEGGPLREIVHFDDPTTTFLVNMSLGIDKVYFSVRETESDIYVMDLEMN